MTVETVCPPGPGASPAAAGPAYAKRVAALTLTMYVVSWSDGATAQAPASKADLLACETLIAARVAMAREPDARTASAVSEQLGCASVPRDGIGAVEQRAMVGGRPYECLTLKDAGRCVWIVPR